MRTVPLVTAVVLLAAPLSTATTIHVPGDQPTIAAGIAAAVDGDTVLVACGTYYETGLVIDGDIVLRSATGQGGTLCLGPSSANDVMGVVDCEEPLPSLWPFRVTGFASDGSSPCWEGSNGCGEDSVPVWLTQLTAVAGDRAVRLSWMSSSQIERESFWIYRSDTRHGGFERLTPQLWRSESPHEYVDDTVEGNRTYWYRVGAVDRQREEELSDVASITTPIWAPLVTGISGIRPNPFLGTSEIRFSIARPGPVRLSVFDVSGRLIRTLVDGELPAGDHASSWDGRNAAGALVTAGVYFTRFEAAGRQETRKTVFLGGR